MGYRLSLSEKVIYGGKNLAHFFRQIHPSLSRLSFVWRKVFQFFIQKKFQLFFVAHIMNLEIFDDRQG